AVPPKRARGGGSRGGVAQLMPPDGNRAATESRGGESSAVADGRAEQGGDAVAGERRGAVAGPAHHLLVGGQRVGDCLLDRLHYGGEERVQEAPGDERELVVAALRAGAEGGGAGGDPAGVGGGEGEEQVAGE